MKVLLALALVLLSVSGFSQSIFRPLPKGGFGQATTAHSHALTTTTPLPDSTFKGFRFTGPAILYALPGSAIFTGVGIDWESDTYNSTTQKWYTNFSVALGGYEGGQFAPNSINAVTAVGLSISFLNKLITVGVMYNLTTKSVQGAVGPSVNLNN